MSIFRNCAAYSLRRASFTGLSAALVCLLTLGCDRNRSDKPVVAKPEDLSVELPKTTVASAEETPVAPPESETKTPNKEVVVPPATELALTGPAESEKPKEASATQTDGVPMTGDDVRAWEKWPDPNVVFIITGQQHGYIEPCGCTGLENQKGGMARRHTLFKQIAAKGWPMVPIDAGNQANSDRFGPQAAIKFQTSVDSLKEMGYRAVGLGGDDLRLGVENLLLVTMDNSSELRFISANVTVYDPESMARARYIESKGHKIGITAAMSPKFMAEQWGADIKVTDPVEGLRRVSKEIAEKGCNYRVLMWYGDEKSAEELLKEVPDWDLVVLGDDDHEPLYQPNQVAGSKALIIPVGHKGMHACLIGLYDDAKTPARYARIPLTDDFDDSPEMLKRLESYQKQLEALGLEGLGLHAIPHPSGGKFIGSETCGECHTTAYKVWKASEHATAMESLIHPPNKRGAIARHFDPECLSCHTTGWNPQKYYPYQGGYLSLTETPKLVAQGCENCHGPGEEHAGVESGDIQADDARTKALREAMRLPLEKAREKCLECHDIDNSPDFHKEGAFEKYWADIVHKGLD